MLGPGSLIGSDFEAAAFGDKRHILPDFHQVTKSVTSEFRNLLLHPSILVQHFLNDFFWYFPRNGKKHPSLVTFTVFSNEHFSTSTVRRFMPWKNVQEKSSRRAGSATGDCCCSDVFFVAQGSKKEQVQKKNNNTFFLILFWKLVGWLVSWKFVSFFSEAFQNWFNFKTSLNTSGIQKPPGLRKSRHSQFLQTFRIQFVSKFCDLWNEQNWYDLWWFMYLYDSKDVSKNTKFHLWHIRKEISAEVERPFAEDQSRRLGRVMYEKIRWPTRSLKLVDFYFYVDNNVNFFGVHIFTRKKIEWPNLGDIVFFFQNFSQKCFEVAALFTACWMQ